ncbi:MAG: TVP38/TMEM64 family protein [Desulfuromonadales bacterium]|nr:TVP38/TMEM64 family protein [Desulfuromonadales bacterium]
MAGWNKLIKIIIGGLWLGLFGSALILWWRSAMPLTEIPRLLEQWLSEFGLFKAASIYVVIYAVRPLILFPATLLTVASGLVFGPWLGVLFTILGENASANLAFVMARWFGRETVAKYADLHWRRWDQKLERNGLVSVLIMRLAMLPFDAVNFGCGLTAVRQRDFALGTFFGILPSLIGFVLLGGTVASGVAHRGAIIGLSVVFLVVGFATAHILKRRERKNALLPGESIPVRNS